MARPKISTKHLQIDKANQAVIAATATAAAVFVFGIFIGRAMLLQQSHQSRVIKEKETAVQILKENVDAKNKIVESYKVFTSTGENVLGGNPDPEATGALDGDNARLVLDALPSKYDFPALVTSVEKLMVDNGYTIMAIEGKDDEINQPKEAQPNPTPTEMPFEVTARTTYEGSPSMLQLFERSIRPFKINEMEITVEDTTIQIKLDAVTYYQPEKAISITEKVVK